ncbi:LysR substrate-binding domain-containing protein [Phaeobacter sp. QD34_3]|uniref:LysR substrate-binding domain-containing protein n=1 Tax=unclassified Phaeobacter TaxID=2621772 RepID=UPI00237FD4E9|nr:MULTISPECIES: LysR substrate-binding domain-containing protein [unclassified Phaeobacter]MDE4132510.1 LysR substrate-binding domain-containing protein [Phaeobacter sp. QD34_3]MDE4136147.1 LysR substrate-binding domain-containing protein [Phaeobacter sp. QD34_24]
MRFTLKQLRYFDAALRTGSIARAAVEMNISQSSITAAIDMIEQTTGAELLRRLPARGIVPTSSGLAVGERIQAFLEQSRIFESDLMALTGDLSGTLRMGCYAPTAPYVLPPILKRISQDYPAIRIELKEGDMQSIAELLSSGAIDVALTYRRNTPDAQPFIPMFRATPIALIPDISPLAQHQEVDLQDLAELPMILLDLPGTRAYFCSLFEARGLRPNIAHTTKSSSVLRGLVAANFGYGLMNICSPNDRVGQSGYVARTIRGDLDSPQYGVAYTAASQRSAIVKSVLNSCREVAERGDFDEILFAKPEQHENPAPPFP